MLDLLGHAQGSTSYRSDSKIPAWATQAKHFYVQGIQAVELRNWIRILVMAHVQPISAEIQLLDAPSSDPEDSCKVI
jgi:hypothetical protein